MPQVAVIKGEVYEGGNSNVMARVLGLDNAPIFQSACVGGAGGVVPMKVFDMSSATPDTAVYSTSLTVSNIIFTALQTDGYWTRDSEGYSFRHMVDATLFTMNGGKRYRVCYLIPTTSFGTIPVVSEIACKSLLST